MSGWSDDESATPAKAQPASSTNNNDWGESEKKFEDLNVNDHDDGDRGGRGGRGRGRGRGRGGNFGNRGDREGGEGENGDRPPRRFNRDDGEGGDRPPRKFNRDNDGEGNDRPPRRNRENDNGGEEGGEDKPKREIYIPPEDTTDENEMFATAISAGINFDKFDNIEVSVTGNGASALPPIESFKESGLREFLLQNVEKSGYNKPTPIQKYAIPIINAKRDLMGCAQTGSGKTAAFVLPILNKLMNDNDTLNPGKPQCLIVAPTRELVIQIRDEARKFALNSYIKVCLAYGGAATRYQGDNITQGCHLLVATPGRLLDFVNKSIISFEDLKFLVLDEADRMLDMGFLSSIEQINNHPTLSKENVTTLMFSATFPDTIQQLAGRFLRDYLFLTIGIVGGASTDVEQEFMEVGKFKKRDKLIEILDQYVNCAEEDRILVFVETKRTADFLASFMSETKISSTSIHGDRLQREREEALRDFRAGKRKVLIATAVAARGLDIKGVTHVINYDLPKDIDEYVHRIGRTGRVGNRGKATSFYDSENSNDSNLRDDLVRILKTAGQPVPAFLGDSLGGALGGDQYGGTDIRKPVVTGQVQVEDDGEW